MHVLTTAVRATDRCLDTFTLHPLLTPVTWDFQPLYFVAYLFGSAMDYVFIYVVNANNTQSERQGLGEGILLDYC